VGSAATDSVSERADKPAENKELARALQRELKRLGCLDGGANGIWNDKSRAAFRSFVRQAKLGVEGDDPNVSVLDAASATKVRVCAVAAKGEETPTDAGNEPKPRAEPQEPAKTKPVPAKRAERIEKEPERPAAKPKQARERRVERQERVQRETRPRREPRQEAPAYREPRESPNAGKRLCFGAGRNELVTCQ
jgi:hypothetical protein